MFISNAVVSFIKKQENIGASMILYGINNCDKVRAANKFLTQKLVDFEFIDLKKINQDQLENLLTLIDWQEIINQKSRIYRQLTLEQLTQIKQKDIQILLNNTSIIKRPILVIKAQYLLGFDKTAYLDLLNTIQE